jgi:hypothetical protein
MSREPLTLFTYQESLETNRQSAISFGDQVVKKLWAESVTEIAFVKLDKQRECQGIVISTPDNDVPFC